MATKCSSRSRSIVLLLFVLLCAAICGTAAKQLGDRDLEQSSGQFERPFPDRPNGGQKQKRMKKKKPEVFVPPSTPNYVELEQRAPSMIHKDAEFIKACKDMAGYYKDPQQNPNLANTIVIVGINYSYRDFLHNFKCHMDELGIKFLPIAMDDDIYNYIIKKKLGPTFLMPNLTGRSSVDKNAANFGGEAFNLIGCRKIEAVNGALQLGYNVVFSDVDIAVVSDPLPYLFIKGVDYVHSQNLGCGSKVKWDFNQTMEGNTGFYAVKSNAVTKRTFDLTFRACSQAPKYDDQTMFWLILRTNRNPAPDPMAACSVPTGDGPTTTMQLVDTGSNSKVVSCPLDDCLFSASNLSSPKKYRDLLQALKSKSRGAVMAHANWLSGRAKKKAALSKHGLWKVAMVKDEFGADTWVCQANRKQSEIATSSSSLMMKREKIKRKVEI